MPLPTPLLRVYLDSSDYSSLSTSLPENSDAFAVQEKLISFASSRKIEFWFSGAHILEMSPLESRYSDAAMQRINILTKLCQRRALYSIDRIIGYEVKALNLKIEEKFEPYSYQGDWFPEIDDDFLITSPSHHEAIFNNLISEQHLNREQRRLAKRKAFKNGKLTPAANHALSLQELENLKEILLQYPMRDQDGLVLSRYFLGKETKENAKEAFFSSLRDPVWMMTWFRLNSEKMTPIIKWLRDPAESLVKTIRKLSDDIGNLRNSIDTSSIIDHLNPQLNNLAREKMQLSMLISICKKISPQSMPLEYTREDFSRYAPGLFTFVTTAVDVMWASTNENARVPKASDYVDLLHSIYAPYVDIFRTDSFMAPLITRNTQQYGVCVIGKLLKIAPCIEQRIKHSC